jgi:uncharacterized protein (TIGR02246 family)
MPRRHRLIVVASFLVASCASTPPVQQRMNEYANALVSKTPHEIASFYAEDGALAIPGLPPLKGRKAIEDFLTPLVAAFEVSSVAMTTDRYEMHGSNAATEEGTYTQVAGQRGKKKQTLRGRYKADWRLDSDGQWRFVRLEMIPQ